MKLGRAPTTEIILTGWVIFVFFQNGADAYGKCARLAACGFKRRAAVFAMGELQITIVQNLEVRNPIEFVRIARE